MGRQAILLLAFASGVIKPASGDEDGARSASDDSVCPAGGKLHLAHPKTHRPVQRCTSTNPFLRHSLRVLLLPLHIVASKHDYCVVGAGPGGLQMAALLENDKRDYVVVEKNPVR